MKRESVVLVVALAIGLIAFGVGYWWCSESVHHRDSYSHREMLWLKKEFKLSDDQYDRIAAIHESFMPQCDELCLKVSEVSASLAMLIADNTNITPEITIAMEQAGELHKRSREAVISYMYEVSAAMSPEQGRRYLEMLLPSVLDIPFSVSGVGLH
ncbi:MAG TPA: hypothetical protein PJ991_12355 [Kiritimatiellia bacterium]|nr:hypothetical protein [Kiritimatiellia bacterium]